MNQFALAVWAAAVVMTLAAATLAQAAPGQPASQPGVLSDSPAAVVNPLVVTDKSIDCSTVEHILARIIRKDMTDEAKVLACYNWVRRVIYHGDGPIQYAYNFHNMVNIFGHGSCLRQTTPMWVLLDRLGYKCRSCAVSGHHLIEVQYGGQWHLFDPHTTFYVYDRSKPAVIASIDQVKADPTLASDAVKEGRACPGFLLCGDSVSMFTDAKAFQITGDFPEAKKYTPVIQEPFGRISLRRGESYVRTWMPGPHWFIANAWRKGLPPSHGCGISRDGTDTVNLPLYEPHAAGRAYRHSGVGYLLYAPDLATDHYADAVVRQTNVQPGKAGDAAGLWSAKLGEPAEIIFSVGCPYVITAGELKLTRLGKGEITASVSNDQGKAWKPVALKAEGNAVAATFVEEVDGSFQGYWLKLAIPDATGFAGLELKSHFELNPYSLPYLVPGKNEVAVEGAKFGSPLNVQWVYAEGPQWKEDKTASQTFDKPGKFTVDVNGEKYPRNVSLTLSVAP